MFLIIQDSKVLKTKTQYILDLTDEEKEELISSLDGIKHRMNELVEKFYFYFLQTKASNLFKTTDMMKQHVMFNSSIGIIIAHINHPLLLQEHLDNLILRHSHYGVSADYIDDFIESFKNALQDIFQDSDDKQFIEMWYKLITSVMSYFKTKIK